MLNEQFRLTSGSTADIMKVTWTAPSDNWISYIFVNGRIEIDAFSPGKSVRSIDLPWLDENAKVVEIHDFAPSDKPTEIQAAITVAPTLFTLPKIKFTPVPGAIRYRIYQRSDSGKDQLIAEIDAAGQDEHLIEFTCTDKLDGAYLAGKWHYFRVEAVSEYGVESNRQAFVWLALDTPLAPVVTLKSGSQPGKYDISIQPQ